jgi:trans-aconitate methyltransferase
MNHWDPHTYLHNAAFVPALGLDVLELLGAAPGQRILDLGCGEGTLTEQIAATGATVVGIDSSPEFVAAAVARGLDARLGNGEALAFDDEFDAVFSNAALHWMRDADAVLEGVARALKNQGRFVAEFGGYGNVAAIHVAIRAVLMRRGVVADAPWYFPTTAQYRTKLESYGFTVEQIGLHPRLTALTTGVAGWLETFAGPMLDRLAAGDRENAVAEIEALLLSVLRDEGGQWTADYVRLRFAARLTRKRKMS